MSVNVHLPSMLRDVAGGAISVEVDGATVRDVVAALDRRWPGVARHLLDEHGLLLGHVLVFVDGDDIRRGGGGLESVVRAGAEVRIEQAMSGG